MTKKAFLVVYDYGMGAAWAYVLADSARQIEERLPQLKVVERRPDWMTVEIDMRLERTMTFDLERPSGWLEDLLG
jgi:hypothetical protein